MHIRIGTRASKLARVQAQKLETALRTAHPHVTTEVVAMTTAGDRELHKQLSDWGYKGLFTKELEDALLNRTVDLAVHSMKDMPSILPAGLMLCGMLPRADVRDAFISTQHASLAALPRAAVVGSSSARRIAQLLHQRPDINIVPLRGNVETRLRKVENGEASATFLAVAGLERLQLTSVIRERIDPTFMLPAVAQGAIGMECRAEDKNVQALVAAISDADTMVTVNAERAMLQALDGSCRTPIGGLAELKGDRITLRGEVLSLDGTLRHAHTLSGAISDAERIGTVLGEELKSRAHAILKEFSHA